MPLNINLQQVFLHMLNFALLFGAMYFLLYQPVKRFMDQRAEGYRKMDDDAHAALAQAEGTKADYEKKLAAVDAEIAQKRADAHAALEKETEAGREQAQQKSEELLSRAREQAQREHDEIVAKAGAEVAELVAQTAEKLVFADTGAAYDSFLSDAEGSSADA